MCSTVVSSKPSELNRRSEISSSSRALVPGGRPRRGAAGSALAVCMAISFCLRGLDYGTR